MSRSGRSKPLPYVKFTDFNKFRLYLTLRSLPQDVSLTHNKRNSITCHSEALPKNLSGSGKLRLLFACRPNLAKRWLLRLKLNLQSCVFYIEDTLPHLSLRRCRCKTSFRGARLLSPFRRLLRSNFPVSSY